MTRSWMRPCLGILFLSPALDGLGAAGPPSNLVPEPGGVVVEEVEEGFTAHKAGLEPGDLLLRWERAASPPANPEAAAGDLNSPFDLEEVKVEQAPRGELTVSGRRGDERLRVRVPPGTWRLRTRPRMTETELETYEEARALLGRKEIDLGLSLWRDLASGFEDGGDHVKASWVFLRIAGAACENRDWETAEGAFDEALREAEASGDATVLSRVTDSLAGSFQDRSEFERASATHREAVEIRRASTSTSLATARSLYHLGVVARKRGDAAAAEDYHRRSLAIRVRLAPQSLDVAESLGSLGIAAGNRGELAAAERFFRRALAIQERLSPQSLQVAASLGNLGSVAWNRGDLATASDFFHRSLAIYEELSPRGLAVARSLNNLGIVAWHRGDMAAAEAYFHRSLALYGELGSQSLAVARSLSNLGSVARERGDLAAAEAYYRRSLDLQEKLAPRSLDVAGSLNNLGALALERRELVTAEDYVRRALAIAPRSLGNAESLRLLGDIALARSDLDSAEDRYERSLFIRRERSPGSSLEAESCHRLATLHRRRNRLDQALGFYDCAVDALEAQKGKLGGSDEARSGFGARYAGTYREAIDLLLEVGGTERAFHLLERYRARELLALLAQRDLVFASDIPEELERRRRSANRRYDRAFGRWIEMSDRASSEERHEAREELAVVRRQQDEIRAEIRAASPRLAALRDPRPMDLAATRAALDPGTLLLSYSVGEEKSYLFALGSQQGALRVFPLTVGEAPLRAQVERFRQELGRGRIDRRPEKALLHARRLTELLLAPAAAQIGRAERLLILADGPLHSLPFAALADPAEMDGRRFLVEAKPVHRAASATVFALLKQARRERRATRLTAFGDPRYPAYAPPDEAAAPQLRAALRSGLDLTPLPATRGEVRSLQRLHPRSSQVYLGAEATEGRAKAVDHETTHLHIASHGLLDDRFPLDSALALSIPSRFQEGEDNGLLQAWEIFEQVRIDADLVTLSACDTGLGQVLGGEGLMGLTRAFLYAGSRSVLASLWSVGDASTGELMQRFYGYLKEGQSKAEALRRAQLDLLRGSPFSHPFHWAGFELVGDWR